MNNIFIISGPSGAGEDSIIKRLGEFLPLEKIVTTTTRKNRLGEIHGRDYYFISPEDFLQKIKNKEFVEYAQEYNGNYYGVTKSELERVKNSTKIGIWKIEYKGVITAKKKFPNIVAIFVNAESLSILEKRIKKRGQVSDKYIKERITYTKEWLKHLDIYDYQVINREGKLDEAVEKIKKIILSNKEKRLVDDIKDLNKNSNFNVWIFQANPKKFDILEALANEKYKEDTWLVSRYERQIKKGDIGIIWVCGKDAGIYALAEIINSPEYINEPEISKKYWKSNDDKNKQKLRVKLKYILKFQDTPILKKNLKLISDLENMLIFKQPQATNFPVTQDEWKLISNLIKEKFNFQN